MQIIKMNLAETAGSSAVKKYFEVPASFELVGATVTQLGSTITADSTNYRTLIIGNNADAAIASVSMAAQNWTQGSPIDFSISNPENAVLTAGQRFSLTSTEAAGGKTVDCAVVINLRAARG